MGLSRRHFNQFGLAGLAAPALSFANERPLISSGIASGDVSWDGGVVWSRTDRPARMWVELSRDQDFSRALRFAGSNALPENDYNAKALLYGLEAGQDWFYRLSFESLEQPGIVGDSAEGRFATAPVFADKSIRFCWSGDTVGQGYGIDAGRGGMRSYETMLSHKPDFLVHSGDQIYADNPVEESVVLDDGSLWRNELTLAKMRVAESTQDFREQYYYNYLDQHMRTFHAQVPVYYQWDDHEVRNNWYPGQQIDDPRYRERSASLLAARSRRAMFECNPLRAHWTDPEQIFRKVSYGPLLDMFFLDLRSFRGRNSQNLQTEQGPDTDFMGPVQLAWLKQALLESTATWKIICSDMPIGPRVTDFGTDIAENGANTDGPPLGRELELADLLGFIHRNNITNMHLITADVHYCASNYYDPENAQFQEFTPFWEFISGPLHAGTFGPLSLDNTFGPRQIFCGVPQDLRANRPPSEGFQFFGRVDIDAESREMRVGHYNVANELLWSVVLNPV